MRRIQFEFEADREISKIWFDYINLKKWSVDVNTVDYDVKGKKVEGTIKEFELDPPESLNVPYEEENPEFGFFDDDGNIYNGKGKIKII